MSTKTLHVLTQPLHPLNPKAWWYGGLRRLLNLLTPLSEGLTIGRRHGFDSGLVLDHVYANQAKGSGRLGRLIDRIYLNAPGWRGIRNRGALLSAAVQQEIRRRAGDQPVRLADLACGGAQPVLQALATCRDQPVDAVLRDYVEANLQRARTHAAARQLTARIERADAFDDADLAALGQQDIVIVFGLHEIIDDDAKVRAHCHRIARLLAPGGTLLLTVQPDHPQLEFIARVLRSHTGRPWAMRLRPIALTWQWLTDAGLRIDGLRMEQLGIFGLIRATKEV
ncbi:MAG: class I SAM-dependent methyltransferase family protein [Rhodothalassiaceae bacterium]